MKASCFSVLLVSCGVNAIRLGGMRVHDAMHGGDQHREPWDSPVDTDAPKPKAISEAEELGTPLAFDNLEWTPPNRRDPELTVNPSSRSNSKPINFLHISKSAGTFFCKCGNNNGRNRKLSHDAAINCHFLREDNPFWEHRNVPEYFTHPPTKSNCQSVSSQMRSRGVDLEGNENFLINGSLCPDFENVFIMRDPIHRLVSHLVYMGVDLQEVTVDDIFEKWPRLSNSYVSRMLGGESVQDLPLGSLPSSLFQKVNKTLYEFDTVFVMSEHLTKDVEYAYGWDCSNAMGRRNSHPGGTRAAVEKLKAAWPSEDWKRLTDQNAMDIELFKSAQLINSASI